MKKFLFLTFLSALFVSFAACSEESGFTEEIDDETVPPNVCGAWNKNLYDISGEIIFVDNKGEYQFIPDDIYQGIDSLAWLYEYRLRWDASLNDSIKKITEQIGSTVSVDAMLCFSAGSVLGRFSGIYKIKKYEPKSSFLCGTVSGPPPAWFFEPMSRSELNYNGRYEMLNVFVHVVRETNGNGFDKAQVSSRIIQWLNYYYKDAHIGFQLAGDDYIDYITSYMLPVMTIGDDYTLNLLTKNSHTDAIDIYVLSKINRESVDGTSRREPSVGVILHPNFMTNENLRFSVAHEVGHCLYLYHTHHGTDGKEMTGFNGEQAIPELVNGTNSEIAGDYIVDTPADPNIWNRTTHTYIGTVTDANGMFYNPDPKNIMSYSYEPNAHFTPGQINCMHKSIAKDEALGKLTPRQISPTAEELGGQYIGGLHFSERTKTLTFPVAAEDEQVTWTISHRCSSGNATSQAPSRVTTKTGKSITLERGGNADYFEVYATTTTPYGMERKSAVWKATAGVPSAAVGTLSWAGGDGTSGSFPGYSPTLVLRNYDTSLTLSYTDLANPQTRRGVSYKLYTSTGGVYDSMYGDFCISEMDISRGYVEVQAIDNCCGADGIRWRIECQSQFDIFSLDVKNGQLSIGVKAATASDEAVKASAKSNLAISSLKIITPEGREMIGRKLDTPLHAMSLSTSSLPKGQYDIEITDLDGKIHKGRFGID